MSTIQRAYKTELDLNNEQITACKRHAGAARWAYNWGLQRKQDEYRAVTRKQKGSQNRKKAAARLSSLYRKVANQQANTLHQFTNRLAKTRSVVVIEDLNVAGMLKNHHAAWAISDVGWGEFRRQLAYKAAWYGCRMVVADRWEKSSKACCRCGWVDKTLALRDRIFRCQNPEGMQVIYRDLNAAINLEKLAGSSPDSLIACGEGSAGLGLVAPVKLPSVKQEPNTFYASA